MPYFDRVLFETDTIGTGPITFVRSGHGYQSPVFAGAVVGDVFSYVLEDGDAWETGRGTLQADTLVHIGKDDVRSIKDGQKISAITAV